ncbi:heptosyltransferase [Chelonobacter oris]|uniref:glycosyltransferase family 9 protein n=1 Tax=Chelonobacter oris TaxID=505317 RepID=UPI002446DEAF|nr:glycosyltransferase family 9 protein [Chelonobacter oris]MDH3000935.1 heptosyltransferase [Chelonobacter oris]
MKKIKALLRRFRIMLGKFLLDKRKKPFPVTELPSIKRILFLRQDGKIGDYIVSSFVFRELKKASPDIEIGVVCSDSTLFEKNRHIDHIYRVKKKNILDYIKTGLKLRKEQYNVLIDPTVFLRNRDLLLLRLIDADLNMGYQKQDYNIFNVSIDRDDLHFSEIYQQLLVSLGFLDIDTIYDMPSSEESVLDVDAFLSKNEIQDYIAVNFFGAAHVRRFTPDNIKILLDILRTKNKTKKIVLLTYPEVTPILKKFESTKNNIFIYENTKNIFQTIELIRHADLVISPDTAIIHIASGFNKKIIGFYQNNALGLANWAPRSVQAVHILFYQHNINEINPKDIQVEWLV